MDPSKVNPSMWVFFMFDKTSKLRSFDDFQMYKIRSSIPWNLYPSITSMYMMVLIFTLPKLRQYEDCASTPPAKVVRYIWYCVMQYISKTCGTHNLFPLTFKYHGEYYMEVLWGCTCISYAMYVRTLCHIVMLAFYQEFYVNYPIDCPMSGYTWS